MIGRFQPKRRQPTQLVALFCDAREEFLFRGPHLESCDRLTRQRGCWNWKQKRRSDDQRETWNIFAAAYLKAAATLRAGTNRDKVYEVWRAELLSHRAAAKTPLAQHAIDSWSKRDNVPYWQIHTTNLVAGAPPDPFPAGMILNFEPIAAIDGQGFFLEDMYLVTKDGAEILTPGVPYTAEEIEAAMR